MVLDRIKAFYKGAKDEERAHFGFNSRSIEISLQKVKKLRLRKIEMNKRMFIKQFRTETKILQRC